MTKKLFLLIAIWFITMAYPMVAMDSNQAQQLALIIVPNAQLNFVKDSEFLVNSMKNGLTTGHYLAQKKQFATKRDLYELKLVTPFEKFPIDIRNEIAHRLASDAETQKALLKKIDESKEPSVHIAYNTADFNDCTVNIDPKTKHVCRIPLNYVSSNRIEELYISPPVQIKFEKEICTYGHTHDIPTEIKDVALRCNASPNKKFLAYLVVAGKRKKIHLCNPVSLHIWDMNTVKEIKTISIPSLMSQHKNIWKSYLIKKEKNQQEEINILKEEGYETDFELDPCNPCTIAYYSMQKHIVGIAIDNSGKRIAIADRTSIMVIDAEKETVIKVAQNMPTRYKNVAISPIFHIGFNALGTRLIYGRSYGGWFKVIPGKTKFESVQLPSFDRSKDYLEKYLRDNKVYPFISNTSPFKVKSDAAREKKLADGWLD
ncbi:MAG: hypothetical protein WCE21_01815 [Candidatus Babeliales bacterium]